MRENMNKKKIHLIGIVIYFSTSLITKHYKSIEVVVVINITIINVSVYISFNKENYTYDNTYSKF